MSLRGDDGRTFDAAAELVPSVTDALIETIVPERRSSLEAWLERAGVPNPPSIPEWLAREGEEAAWVLAARCRRDFAAMRKYGGGWPYAGHELVERLRMLVEALRSRPAGPWLWAEAFHAIPSYRRITAEHASGLRHGFVHGNRAAVQSLLRAKTSFRSILFDAIARDGALEIDDALGGLADPVLRETSEEYLRDHVRDVESDLRAALASATKGEREAIVRLLRRIDPKLGSDGKAGPADLGELEAALRTSPRDLETGRIWADLLMDRGDPRGQLASLLHAMVDAPPERALELSEQIATFTAEHRKQLVGKPGGFPFRDKYLGRGAISFRSTWRAMLRGKPAKIVERVHDFLDRVTNLEPPARPDRKKLDYAFKLTWPGTKVCLPFQEDGHYPSPLGSSITLELESGKLVLVLAFPFESFDDRSFHLVYDAIAETLTKLVLTPTGFGIMTPTVDGKRLKGKRARFMR